MNHTVADFSELLHAFSQVCFEESDGAQVDFARFQATAAEETTAAFSADNRLGLRADARVLLAEDGGLPLFSKVVGLWRRGAVPLIAPTGASAANPALAGQIDWRWNGDRPIRLGQRASSCLPGDGHDPTAIIHVTSGSTGTPKLAPRSTASLLDEARRYRARYGFAPGERVLAAAPIVHSFGFGALLGLAASGAIIGVPPVFNARRLASAIIAGRYAAIILTPQMARLLVEAAHRIRAQPAPTLRLAIAGAGAVSDALSTDFATIFGCSLGRNYGCSETGATFGEAEALPDGVIGRPFDGVRIISPTGKETAELILDLGHTVLANEEPALSVWRSGDRARRLPNGAIQLLGRCDSRVKVNGHTVNTDNLTNAARAVPGVTDAIALVLQAPSAPDRDYLALVCEGEAIACESLAEAFAGRGMARPHTIATLESFPRTVAGKPDRDRIVAAVAAGQARQVVFAAKPGQPSRESPSRADAGVSDGLS